MSYKSLVAVLSLLALFVCQPVSAAGATVYVAKNGNNTANSGAIDSPYLTIGKCLSVISPGDACSIRGGTYAETFGGNATLPSGTSWTNAITIRAQAGETVIIAPGYGDAILDPAHGESYQIWENIIFDAAGVQFGIGGNGDPHHFRFLNCEVKNATRSGILPGQSNFFEFINVHSHHNGTDNQDHGIYMAGADNLIEGGLWHDNSGVGIHIYDTNSSTVSRNTVRNARMYNNGTGGIILTSGSDNIAYNNLIYGNKLTGASISESDSSNNNKLYNNTIYNNGGFGLLIGGGATGAQVRNNISYNNGATNLYNLGNASTVQNNYTSDPLFTNAASGDFTVRANSGTIDAGADLSSIFKKDFSGAPRPLGVTFDIGAYEHGAAGDTTPPTVTITAPAHGAPVSGTITVTATAIDNVGVVGVQFLLDGANLGAEVTSPPYTISWDTTKASSGNHTVTAVARDAAGNQRVVTQQR